MTHAYRMAAIREREAAAQRGDWFCDGYDIWHCGESYESKTDPHFYTGVSLDPNLTKSSKALANLDFCAQARSDIPYLLERVEALEAALGEAIDAIEDWGGYVSDYFKDKHDLQSDINRLKAIKEGTTDAD